MFFKVGTMSYNWSTIGPHWAQCREKKRGFSASSARAIFLRISYFSFFENLKKNIFKKMEVVQLFFFYRKNRDFHRKLTMAPPGFEKYLM
jgi:hypothetical protein